MLVLRALPIELPLSLPFQLTQHIGSEHCEPQDGLLMGEALSILKITLLIGAGRARINC